MRHLCLSLIFSAALVLHFNFTTKSEGETAHDRVSVQKAVLPNWFGRLALFQGISTVFSVSEDWSSMNDMNEENITNAIGTIRLVSSGADWYGIVPDHEKGLMYAPSNLPGKFKKDGVQVKFSGKVSEIPPNVRMWGIPLDLTKIEELRQDRE